MVPGRIRPASSDRVSWPVVLIAGLAGGLAWGVFARVWMRFISTDPQFTWNGTLFIVIGFGLAGLAQSAAFLGRRAHLRRPQMTALRVATFASLLPLGMAAGGPVFPDHRAGPTRPDPYRLVSTDEDRGGSSRDAAGPFRREDPLGGSACRPNAGRVPMVPRHLRRDRLGRWVHARTSARRMASAPSRPRRGPGRIEHRVLALRLLAHRGPGLICKQSRPAVFLLGS